MFTQRIIACPRGSWRWQNAYKVAIYRPHQTRDGRWIWKNDGYSSKRMSEPQIRRSSFRGLDWGGLHNQELTPAQCSMAVFARDGYLD